ncbi:uncharacterized protein LOC131660734 [Vicia villosa]|uniref:uncharacterized protein LOC131660734 n=1 Tax=Vicia villosa TaxID=3911 RepID=UPI00273C6B27|nr:uncharacterized protein LOC131660734 [Vicia villosa]
MRLRCLFRLRYAPSGIGWKGVVNCGMHNHTLDKDMLGHDILGRLKDDEIKFVNDMTKYNMAPRYRLPLLEIVDVTSTKLTFSIAFAYLEHEMDENFTWALQRLKELLYFEKLLPDVMVTDRELALMNAIDSVYPNASHLLYTFHISKNVSRKCKDYVKLKRLEHVMDQWNNMMYSNTEDKFDIHLNHFESVCGDIPSFVKYVKETWLTPYKESFVVAWTNRVTHLENTTTNRVESADWKLKNMLTISRSDLCASWRKSEICWSSKKRCGCYIRITHGLQCACQLAGYQILGIPIPMRALKKKLCDIAYPSTPSTCPPPVKYKPKRRVKKSRKGGESDVHRDPSQWKYVDASQGSQTTKKSCTQPSGSQSSTMLIGKQPSINSAKSKYLSQFLAFFHPYIDDIVNVELDGNYGFHCISSALGWGEDACYDV